MLQKFKKICRPTAILMMIGFSISFTSVLIGISSVDSVLSSINSMNSDSTPIYNVMENTGMTLALKIYLFSIADCLVTTNYWIITKHREMAIRKAFGWSNMQLAALVFKEMGTILLISMTVCSAMLTIINSCGLPYLSIHLSFSFIIGTIILLLLTLFIASIIPIRRILKIHPAEVIS